MGLFDDLEGKAQGLIAGNEEAIRDGIEKVGDFVDAQTGGKFASQVDLVQGAAADYVTNLEAQGGQASNTEPPQQ